MNYSELDDLKSAWQTLNRNLERQHALALHQFRESKLGRFRSGFRALIVGRVILLIFGVLITALSARFWVNHFGVAHLMIYGILLHAYGVMMIFFAARDLILIKGLDYTTPVLVLQKRIAELRRWQLHAALWFGVTSCFIWIPLLLIVFHGLGADIWMHHPEVIGWFVLNSLVGLGLLFGIVIWSRRPGMEKFARSLENSSVGRSVNRAQAMLEEIERFERE